MTISTTSNQAAFNGNASTTVFPYTFPIPDADYASVIYEDADGNLTTLTSSQYTLTGVGDADGGTVIYPLVGSPIASGTHLYLIRTLPLQQLTDLENQGGYFPDTVEDALDYLMMCIQQLNSASSGSIAQTVTNLTATGTLSSTGVTNLSGEIHGLYEGILISGTYAVGEINDVKALIFTGGSEGSPNTGIINLPDLTTMPNGFHFYIATVFTNVTVNAFAGQYINGVASVEFPTNTVCMLYTNGTEVFGWAPITLQTFVPGVAPTISGTQWLQFAIGDQTNAITTGTAKFTTRFPRCQVLDVRASLKTASSSGIPTFDINEGGTSILSTKLTIDANEKTSTTAATQPVISDANIAEDSEITFDIDVAGTGAVGPIITIQVKF